MAHFAKIDENNLVVTVHVVANKDILDDSGNESEAKGIEFLTKLHGDISPMYWKQTSYGTHGGKHYTLDSENQRVESLDSSKALRKNFAGEGHTYDSARDAFIPPRPQKSNGAIVHHSWNFNEDTCLYEPPVDHPDISHPGKTDFQDENGDAQTMVCSWDEHKGRWMCAYKKSDDTPPDESLVAYAWNPNTAEFEDSGFTRAEFLDINYTGDK